MLDASRTILLSLLFSSICALPSFTTLHFLGDNRYRFDFTPPETLTDIECYNRLDETAIGRTFRLNVDSKFGLPCIVELPSWTNIELEQLNLATNLTSIRVISGNDRMRPVLGSPLLTKDSMYDRSFNINCLYGFLVVRNEHAGDDITFKVTKHPEEPTMDFIEECY